MHCTDIDEFMKQQHIVGEASKGVEATTQTKQIPEK
jgi:hypothetical protein